MDEGKHGIFDDAGSFRLNEGPASRYENLGCESIYRVGKKRAGRQLDRREWNELPAKF